MRNQRLALGSVLVTLVTVALAGCTTPTPGGDGGAKQELVVGTILPFTGSLEKFGTIMEEGAEKAAAQVNAASGTFRVKLVHENSETNPAAGASAANKLKVDGAAVIVGAAASGVSKAVLEVAGPSRIVQISPSSTSPEFTSLMSGRGAGERFFFRTSPSDALQGKVAGAYAQARNWTCVAMLYDNNPYGNGLRSTFTETFGQAGNACLPGQRTVRAFGFEEKQASYDSVLQQALAGCTAAARAACPDGIFFAGYPTEGKQMVRDWWSRVEWRDIPWLFSEGVQEQSFFDDLRNAGISAVLGFEGTAPVGTGPGYQAYQRILGKEPPLFSAHTFDAVMLASLAAEKAGSRDSAAIRDAMRAVAGPPGEKVGPADFARAVGLLRDGQDIDYEGAAGSQNFDANGDVTSAYEIYSINDQGKLARKCLVPESTVTASPVRLPSECTARRGAPTEPPQRDGLTWTLKESGGVGTTPWSIEPKVAQYPANRPFNVTLVNDPSSATPHNLTLIEGTNGDVMAKHDPHINPGQRATMQVPGLPAGAYTYYCSVPGHRSLGMEGTLTVA